MNVMEQKGRELYDTNVAHIGFYLYIEKHWRSEVTKSKRMN